MSNPASRIRNICLTLAYDGTHYLGWQKTKEGPSIEETLETCLAQILQETPILQAASRTDAGVHAQGQMVNFTLSKNRKIPLEKLQISLNSLLPNDIVVTHVQEAATEFHPTLDCIGKIYHYRVCCGPVQLPQNRFYSWHYPYSLDPNLMRQAAQFFTGEHDFSALCNEIKQHPRDDYVRTIQSIVISEGPQSLHIAIQGNHFLYKMARNIAGTLVYIGKGKIAPEDVPKILESRQRPMAGITAPAHGLTLYQVLYGE